MVADDEKERTVMSIPADGGFDGRAETGKSLAQQKNEVGDSERHRMMDDNV